MAKSKRKANHSTRRARRPQAAGQHDAIALLKADHEQVKEWFEQFAGTRSHERKRKLASQICQALKIHTQIEAEIFYPAFLEATQERDVHHEAEIEHEGAKRLIADIEDSGPDDDHFDARITVLSEMIKHHVNEEEKRDGMFASARKADMDLVELGQRLKRRKAQLTNSGGATDDSGESRERRSVAQSGA